MIGKGSQPGSDWWRKVIAFLILNAFVKEKKKTTLKKNNRKESNDCGWLNGIKMLRMAMAKRRLRCDD